MTQQPRRHMVRILLAATTSMAGLIIPTVAFAQQAGTQLAPGSHLGTNTAPTAAVPARSPSAGDQSPEAMATGGLQDIVVTARKSFESQQRVPIAITTVTAQTLTDLAVRDVYEIQKVTPGLYITSSQTAGRVKVTIRGQSEADARLTTDPSVGVYVDGVNWVRDYGLRSSLVDIAQIEVLKGPQGTLFGKNTTGGALNITTQHPTYQLGGYADLTYGSHNNAQALAVVNAPLVDDKIALRLVAQVISRDGYSTYANGHEIADDHVYNGRVLLRIDPTDNLHILLSADGVRQRDAGPTLRITKNLMLQNGNTPTGALGAIAKQLGLNPALAADRLTAYNAWLRYYNQYQTGSYQRSFSRGPVSAPNLFDNLDHYGFSANTALDVGPVTLRSITAYRHLTKSYFQDVDGTPFDLSFTQQSTRQQNFSEELQASAIDGFGLDWQAGAFYNRETGNEFAVSNTNDYVNVNRGSLQDADVTNTSLAGYAQAVYNISRRVRVTAGVRYTRDKREMDSKNRVDPAYAYLPTLAFPLGKCNLLTPALGGPVFPNCSYGVSVTYSKPTFLISADWRPIQDTMLYASVSTGYRAGGFTYQGSVVVQPSRAALDAAFTPYLPETVTNYEAGFKSDLLNRRLRVNGAIYYEDYRNIQARIRDVVNGLIFTLIRNAAKAKLYGGELEVTAAPVDHLTFTATGSYIHAAYDKFLARDSAGNLLDLTSQPFSVPKWTYNLGGAYDLPIANGFIRFSTNFAWISSVNLSPGSTDASVASLTQRRYGLLDGRIGWHIASQNLDISMFGKNLTDKRYLTSVNASEANGWNTGTPGAPRTVGVQLRKTF